VTNSRPGIPAGKENGATPRPAARRLQAVIPAGDDGHPLTALRTVPDTRPDGP